MLLFLYLALASAAFLLFPWGVLSRMRTSAYGAVIVEAKYGGVGELHLVNKWDFSGSVFAATMIYHFFNNSMLNYLELLHRRHGTTFALNVLGRKIIFTCDAENLNKVFWERRMSPGTMFTSLRDVTPGGLFVLEGKSRNKVRSEFVAHFANVKTTLNLLVVEQSFQKLRDGILSAGLCCDLQPLFTKYLAESLATFTVGEDLDTTFGPQAKENQNFMNALAYAQHSVFTQGLRGLARIPGASKRFWRSVNVVQSHLTQIILKNRLLEDYRPQAEAVKTPRHHKSFVRTLLDKSDSPKDDIAQIRDSLATAFLPGYDSIASLLSNAFWLLSRDQNVWARLRKEVLDTVGLLPPTYDELHSMTYLGSVLDEGGLPSNLDCDCETIKLTTR